MGDQKPVSRRTALLLGLVCIAAGGAPVLAAIGVIPAEDQMNAPAWVVALAGMVFVLGGAALMIQGLGGASATTGELPPGAPRWMRAAQYMAALFIFGAFAMIASWIAIGPGERAFSMSVGGAGMPAGVVIGRIAFGIGAVICWLAFAGALTSVTRKLAHHGGDD